jgi:transcriptional regulator with XRE-family HTH domain
MEVAYRMDLVSQPTKNYLAERTDWQDIEARQAYMEACVEQDIAWQINLNRKKRELTQKQLAEKVGTTQTAIARWEDTCYGRHSIPSLVKIAHAFDCALVVRLVPYSKLAELTKNTSKEAFLAASFEQEIANEK